MRKPFACFLIALCFAGLSFDLLTTTAVAQVPPEQQAVVAFEVYLDRLSESELAKESGAAEQAAGLMGPGGAENTVDPQDLHRIFGAAAAPPSIQSFIQMQQGVEQLDFNFFVRMQFKNAQLADKGFEEMKEGSTPVTLGGKEYFRPSAEDNPPKNVAFHKISDDTVEIGTDEYLQLPTRNLFSANLKAAWPKMPRAGVRVALDFDGARKLIDEAVLMGGEQIPPQALTVISNTSVFRLGIDFSGDSLIWLTATGKDAGGTQKINETLSGLMEQAKAMAGFMLPQAPPAIQEPAKVILAALGTKVAGDDVSIEIPRPDGLGEAVSEMVGQMFMGAMGPGGPGAEFGPGPGGFGDAAPGFGEAPAGDGAAEAFGGDDPFN